MSNPYHDTLAALEKQGVARDYIIGWASGYQGSPKREQQRLTAGYEAGYADGAARHADNAGDWKTGKAGKAGKTGAGAGAADAGKRNPAKANKNTAAAKKSGEKSND
ncbi:MAG: hypothetical protein OXU71_01360 [Gammaproteobacteria bacterium]|nr:hypothetical protein [Gammaproteobacteria bacterium]